MWKTEGYATKFFKGVLAARYRSSNSDSRSCYKAKQRRSGLTSMMFELLRMRAVGGRKDMITLQEDQAKLNVVRF